jgi:hypothetical protein
MLDFLKKPLEDYLKKVPKVRLIRNNVKGIASTRNMGFLNAVGPVIISVRFYLVFTLQYFCNNRFLAR